MRWLGDAAAIVDLPEADAVGTNIARIFAAPDRALEVHLMELATARREGRAEDTRWHVKTDGTRFWANGITMPFADGRFLKVFRDETRLKVAEEQRILLLNELNHRVRNTLATVQSVAEQALRSAGVSAEIRSALTERLHALSRAHNVLVDESWAGADLRTIVQDAVSPYGGGAQVSADGPDVRLHPSQAVTVALILHELTTNALKYGSLGDQAGQVVISWNESSDVTGHRRLSLLWRESGGPPVSPPTRRGFGSRLLKQAAGSMNGSVDLRFDTTGLVCVLDMTLVDEAVPIEQTLLEVGQPGPGDVKIN
ncbi:MAG TPA: HWE histidine kinase domain-containing protein [Brevundimonas sp.]|nr:HWE histidine kinase domain-containing protein [Brevundimonas sp.]